MNQSVFAPQTDHDRRGDIYTTQTQTRYNPHISHRLYYPNGNHNITGLRIYLVEKSFHTPLLKNSVNNFN